MSTNFRIMNPNYIDIDVLGNDYVSSEDVDFPVTNLYNQTRRTKTWRSAGYWPISNANRLLKFKETSGGSTLTASLNVGTYSTTTELLTEVKRALESAGGSTYTVDRTNLKIRITSDGGGGGGDFELVLSGSTLAPYLGFTSDKTGALTYTADLIKQNLGFEYILWDLGVQSNPDCFIMIGERNDAIKISPNATITLQANETDNFDDATPSFEQVLTYTQDVVSHLTDSGIADKPYRYWRLKIEDVANPRGFVELSAVFLGNFISPTRGSAAYPLQQEYIDYTSTMYSEGAQSFSDIKPKTQRFSVSIEQLQKEDIEEFDTFFAGSGFSQNYGIGKPFFISMDSSTVFSTNLNRRIVFCKLETPPRWNLLTPDNFRLDLIFREEL